MIHPLVKSIANSNIEEVVENNNLSFKKCGNIAIFKYNKDAKYGSELQKKSRGVIVDLDTKKIICSSFSGSYSLEQFIDNVSINNCIVEENIEGTLINMYFYGNRWKISTKFSINADETRFKSHKTFRQLLDDVVDITSLKNLDRNFTYSFVLVHKDLRLVTPVTENKIYHIETTNNITGEKIFCDIGIEHPKILYSGNNYVVKNTNVKKITDYQYLIDKISSLIWSNRGFMLYSIDRKFHCSYINQNYQKVKDLVKNQSDVRYICLESLYYKKNNNELLKYFPEYNSIFIDTINNYNKLCKYIHKLYLDIKCFKKQDISYPSKFKKAIFDIHGIYLKNKNNNLKERIDISTIELFLKGYDCPYLFNLMYK